MVAEWRYASATEHDMRGNTRGSTCAMQLGSLCQTNHPSRSPHYRSGHQTTVPVTKFKIQITVPVTILPSRSPHNTVPVTRLPSRSPINTVPVTSLWRQIVSFQVLRVRERKWDPAQTIGHQATDRMRRMRNHQYLRERRDIRKRPRRFQKIKEADEIFMNKSSPVITTRL